MNSALAALHGDLSQAERTATMARFKAGELRLMVCSDVAARGDGHQRAVATCSTSMCPTMPRIMCTASAAPGAPGLTGHAFTLATPDDRLAVEAIESAGWRPHPAPSGRGARCRRVGRRAMGKQAPGARPPRRRRAAKAEKPRQARACAGRGGTRPSLHVEPKNRESARPSEPHQSPKAQQARAGRGRAGCRPREPAAAMREMSRPPRREGRFRDDDLGPAGARVLAMTCRRSC